MDLVAGLHEEIAARKELDAIAQDILTFVKRIDEHEHQLLTRLREFDARQGWVREATSCARWLSWWTGLSMQAARERVRVARALGGLPLIDAAMRRGELSYSKVRALTRVATPETELKWIETARGRPADHLEFLCRERGNRARLAAVPKRVDRRFVRRRNTPHGMVRIEIQLPPAEAEVVWEAIAAATERAAAQPAASVPESEEERAPESTAAVTASETTPTSEDAPTPAASAEATPEAVDFAEERRRFGEEALRRVHAELRAAKEARMQRRPRTRPPANDAPDLEELRAEGVVAVAESFLRLDPARWRGDLPRPR